MLRIAAPHIDAWNAWYNATGNAPAGVAPLLAAVDAAARAAGREPAEIERTVAVLVQLPGGTGRLMGDTTMGAIPALSGPAEVLAEERRAYARAGIGAVQLVLDPITLGSIEAFGPVLELLDRD